MCEREGYIGSRNFIVVSISSFCFNAYIEIDFISHSLFHKGIKQKNQFFHNCVEDVYVHYIIRLLYSSFYHNADTSIRYIFSYTIQYIYIHIFKNKIFNVFSKSNLRLSLFIYQRFNR